MVIIITQLISGAVSEIIKSLPFSPHSEWIVGQRKSIFYKIIFQMHFHSKLILLVLLTFCSFGIFFNALTASNGDAIVSTHIHVVCDEVAGVGPKCQKHTEYLILISRIPSPPWEMKLLMDGLLFWARQEYTPQLGTSHGGLRDFSSQITKNTPTPTQIRTSHGGLRDSEGTGVWRLIAVSPADYRLVLNVVHCFSLSHTSNESDLWCGRIVWAF